ncbi:MAG: hypothetical protein ACTSXC_04215 [Candidatus Freyarchaeota archaeon]
MDEKLRPRILMGGDRLEELKAHYSSPCARCPYARETPIISWDCGFDPAIYTWCGIPKDCPKRSAKRTRKREEQTLEELLRKPIQRRRKYLIWSPAKGWE